MERREFLRLGAIFGMGAIISTNVGSILRDLSGFKEPSYIYKIKHRAGLIVVFSSEHPDERNRKLPKKLEDHYFFSKSLELIKIVEKKDLDTEIEIIKNTDEVKRSEDVFRKNLEVGIDYNKGREDNKDYIDKNIKSLNLYRWWNEDLLEEDRNIIRETHSWDGSFGIRIGLKPTMTISDDFGNAKKISLSVSKGSKEDREAINSSGFDDIVDCNREVIKFLNSVSSWCGYLSPYKYSSTYEKILLKLDDYIFDFGNVKDIHNHYDKWIIHSYKRREEDIRYLELTKYYCFKQIDIAEDYMEYCMDENIDRTEDYIKDCGNPPEIPYDYIPIHKGSVQLSIILEKEGKYDEAINICKNALRVGFQGDWEKRIERNSRKFEKMKLA
jgi:tetratricopeptide (TPR) repeat protein